MQTQMWLKCILTEETCRAQGIKVIHQRALPVPNQIQHTEHTHTVTLVHGWNIKDKTCVTLLCDADFSIWKKKNL
uniref:Uncharacterized protein n=1 Tax=Anguilla anguilla TaxID=7936 RepID=A0A0E9XMU6_ANGAN